MSSKLNKEIVTIKNTLIERHKLLEVFKEGFTKTGEVFKNLNKKKGLTNVNRVSRK